MTEPNVGQRLRALREERGLSLRALAERCGLSFNAISRIEHGDHSPTVASLHLLATALGVPITAFFEDRREQSVVLVRGERRSSAESNGILIESLGAGLRQQQLEPFLVTLEPGAGSQTEAIAHAGEEFVHCLEGTLTYTVAGDVIKLRAGDSLLFDATQPHTFGNRGQALVRFLIVFRGTDNRHAVDQHHWEDDQNT
jgi:transcriptional regulator with XRE-family HTH domain